MCSDGGVRRGQRQKWALELPLMDLHAPLMKLQSRHLLVGTPSPRRAFALDSLVLLGLAQLERWLWLHSPLEVVMESSLRLEQMKPCS